MGKKKKLKQVKKAANIAKEYGGKYQSIMDRISYILFKTGKQREDLHHYLNLDPSLEYYEQPGRTTTEIIKDCADFLGVSVHWLMSGDKDPDDYGGDKALSISRAGTIEGSALLQGNTAGSIVVNAGGETLTTHERELLRIYRSVGIKQQILLLNYGYKLENSDKPQ